MEEERERVRLRGRKLTDLYYTIRFGYCQSVFPIFHQKFIFYEKKISFFNFDILTIFAFFLFSHLNLHSCLLPAGYTMPAGLTVMIGACQCTGEL